MQRNVRNGQKIFRFGKKQNSAQLFARLPKVRNYDLAECFLVMKVTRRSIPPYVCLVIMIIRCYAPSLRFVASPSSAPPPHPLTHRLPPRTSVCSATIEPIESNPA